jgi:hypothetical protein
VFSEALLALLARRHGYEARPPRKLHAALLDILGGDAVQFDSRATGFE